MSEHIFVKSHSLEGLVIFRTILALLLQDVRGRERNDMLNYDRSYESNLKESRSTGWL